MIVHLANKINNFPNKPGVYQYFDLNNKLLYVGKAKDLKKRIKNYFINSENGFIPNPKNSPRIQKMTSQIHDIRIIIVENEKEALILENSFIKTQNPKYNILLRDDKTYPYIYIDLNDKYPRFNITREIFSKKDKKESKIIYFGPYVRGAKEILDSIYELFKLVQRSSCVKSKKPCLYFQLDKCLAPCAYECEEEYKKILMQALDLLNNKSNMIKKLESKMIEFAEILLFEEAKKMRDCINVLRESKLSIVDLKKLYDIDILSFISKKQNAILLKLFIREGKLVSSDHIFLRFKNINEHEELEISELENEVYTQALIKISHTKTLAKNILIANIINFELLKEATKELNLKIKIPKTKDEINLSNLALQNALMILESKQKELQNEEEILNNLASLFLFENKISSIEIFDTSHHSGDFCVGAMVYYENGEFVKQNYRHYKLDGKDEVSQMRDMLTRRAKSFLDEKFYPPSLWILDGGKIQLNLALQIIESSGINIDVIAISKEKRDSKSYRSKGAALDILRSKRDSSILEFKLDAFDKRLLFIQKLRDEAHRFAISFHREQKLRSIRKS